MAQIIGREARYNAYLAMLKETFTPYAEIDVLNPDGTTNYVIGNDFVQTGSVNVAFQNGTRRTASITLENTYKHRSISPNDIWFGQQYRVRAGLLLPDGTPYTLPQGVFYIKDPERTLNPNANTITLNLTDKWAYLDGTLFGNLEGNFVAEIDTDIYSIVSAILAVDRGNGVPIDNVKPLLSSYFKNKEVQLPDGRVVPVTNVPYTMRVEPQDKTYADILLELNNMLAGIIGYDNTGRLRIEPSNYDIEDKDKANLWEFSPKEREFLGATYAVKMSEVYNVVQVIGATLNGMQAQGIVSNLDPSSPTSVKSSLGRRIKRLTSDVYYSDEQCVALGLWHLKRLNVLQQSVSFSCTPMYHLQENMLVSIYDPRKDGRLTPHLINSFTLPIGVGEERIDVTSVDEQDISIIAEHIIIKRILAVTPPQLTHELTAHIHKARAAWLGNGRIDTEVDYETPLLSQPSAPLYAALNTAVECEPTLLSRPISYLTAELEVKERADIAELIPRASALLRVYETHTASIYGELLTNLVEELDGKIQIISLKLNKPTINSLPPSPLISETDLYENYTAQLQADLPRYIIGETDLYENYTAQVSSIPPIYLSSLGEAAQHSGGIVQLRLGDPLQLSASEEVGVSSIANLEAYIHTILLEGETDLTVGIDTAELHKALANPLESVENEFIFDTTANILTSTPTPLYADFTASHGISANLVDLLPTVISARGSGYGGSVIGELHLAVGSAMSGETGGTHGYDAEFFAGDELPIEGSVGGRHTVTANMVAKYLAKLDATVAMNFGYSPNLVISAPTSLSATMGALETIVAEMHDDTPTALVGQSGGTFGIAAATMSFDLPTYISAIMNGYFGIDHAILDMIPQGDLAAQGDFYGSSIATISFGEAVLLIAEAEGLLDVDPNLGVAELEKILASANGVSGETASLGAIVMKSIAAIMNGNFAETAQMSCISLVSLQALLDSHSNYSATMDIIGLIGISALLNGYGNSTADMRLSTPVSLSATTAGNMGSFSLLSLENEPSSWNVYINLGTVTSIVQTHTAPPSSMTGEIHYTFTTALPLDTPFFNITLPEGYVIVENDFNDYVEGNCVYSATLYNTGQRNSNGDIIIGLSVINWTLSTSRSWQPTGAVMDASSDATPNLATSTPNPMQALATGTFGSDAILTLVSYAFAWNNYYNLGTISNVFAILNMPPTDLTGEIHLTYTTGNSVQSQFWDLIIPSGYSIVENDCNDLLEAGKVYESTLYNTGQTDTDGNIIIGISTIEWS